MHSRTSRRFRLSSFLQPPPLRRVRDPRGQKSHAGASMRRSLRRCHSQQLRRIHPDDLLLLGYRQRPRLHEFALLTPPHRLIRADPPPPAPPPPPPPPQPP